MQAHDKWDQAENLVADHAGEWPIETWFLGKFYEINVIFFLSYQKKICRLSWCVNAYVAVICQNNIFDEKEAKFTCNCKYGCHHNGTGLFCV